MLRHRLVPLQIKGKYMSSGEKLVMTCEVCGAEMIALHGFLVTCPKCPEQNEPCQAVGKIKDGRYGMNKC